MAALLSSNESDPKAHGAQQHSARTSNCTDVWIYTFLLYHTFHTFIQTHIKSYRYIYSLLLRFFFCVVWWHLPFPRHRLRERETMTGGRSVGWLFGFSIIKRNTRDKKRNGNCFTIAYWQFFLFLLINKTMIVMMMEEGHPANDASRIARLTEILFSNSTLLGQRHQILWIFFFNIYSECA